MKVKIKKLHNDAVIPEYASPGDAGMDLVATSYSYNDFYGFHEYGTGLAMEIPEGYVGLVFPRSSISKKDLTLANSIGVIDSGYRGEIKLRFKEGGIKKALMTRYVTGERIGQIVILPYPKIEFEQVTKLDETNRGDGGFGSTGE